MSAPKVPAPTDHQLELAAFWLTCNEGADGEAEACAAVATWLVQFQSERMVRREALRAGIPVARVRAKIAGESR